MSVFAEEYRKKTEQIETVLGSFLPAEEGFQKTVLEAVNYSLTAGGKRLRPLFLAECNLLCGGGGLEDGLVRAFAAALEMIHTYSLIHDDLPAMDDDDFRRGRPSSHKAFDEATAILAGDALLT
ncbi:MAG: polyprenyl synthetase family protein, partial [Lachnospiraceae bacterium]|nr:polyprenyl synthetase family protein [Lachnospiraceae bacterium]